MAFRKAWLPSPPLSHSPVVAFGMKRKEKRRVCVVQNVKSYTPIASSILLRKETSFPLDPF